MSAKTIHATVVLIGSGKAEDDLGQKDITIRTLIEQGRDVGFYAHFDHDGQTLSGSVADISPPDWEKHGVTPIVRVNRSIG